MFESHERQRQLLREKFGNRLWYVEVIAVNPDRQGRGLGSRMMQAVLEVIQSEPVFLECTDKSNIGFYEKFGFRVVDEAKLQDGDDVTISWIMIRAGKSLE